MKSATLSDLRRNFRKIEQWLTDGEELEITRRGKVVGTLHPLRKKLVHPDYEARAKAIWGDRIFSQEEVDEMRAFETGEP